MEEEISARWVLEQILPYSHDIEDILVMMRDADGKTGFVTNLDGFEESLAFVERVKHGMMSVDSKGEI